MKQINQFMQRLKTAVQEAAMDRMDQLHAQVEQMILEAAETPYKTQRYRTLRFGIKWKLFWVEVWGAVAGIDLKEDRP